MREVGPSRKILHVRDVGSERRKPVTQVVGSWAALGATRKIIVRSGRLVFWPLQGPPISGCRMRRLLWSFLIAGLSQKLILCDKTLKYTIYSFAFWSPKRAPKCFQIDGISSLFLNWKTPKNRNRQYNPSLFGRPNEVQNNSKSIEFLRYFKLSNTKN